MVFYAFLLNLNWQLGKLVGGVYFSQRKLQAPLVHHEELEKLFFALKNYDE